MVAQKHIVTWDTTDGDPYKICDSKVDAEKVVRELLKECVDPEDGFAENVPIAASIRIFELGEEKKINISIK